MDLSLPSPAALLASLVFSVIGFGVFMYGKKQGLVKPIAIGVALMVFPYFVSRVWLQWVIGVGLCASLYVFRD